VLLAPGRLRMDHIFVKRLDGNQKHLSVLQSMPFESGRLAPFEVAQFAAAEFPRRGQTTQTSASTGTKKINHQPRCRDQEPTLRLCPGRVPWRRTGLTRWRKEPLNRRQEAGWRQGALSNGGGRMLSFAFRIRKKIVCNEDH